ncbi:MAG TPA: sulfatase [Candidatus Limnocylindria bacterium]|nr:sulfatase [Candidatus Limnocylindria bacterium]
MHLASRTALLAAALIALPSAMRAGERLNVLLVSIDSLRRDALGCYGARLPYAPGVSPTPHLDDLAASGVRLTDAYAPSPWTLPSHVSLLTGMSPLVHGVETDLQTMSGGSPTLAEVLRGAGYRTAGVFSGPYLEEIWGFGRGFERYTAAYGPSVASSSALLDRLSENIIEADRAGDAAMAEELRWLRRAGAARIGQLSSADVSAERVTARALEELARFGAGPAPWFLFVHYFDVHYDYIPPPPWDRAFDPHYDGHLTGEGFVSNPEIAVPDASVPDGYVRRVSDRDLEHLRALYMGEAAWVDQHVGRLVARLDAMGLAGRTLVIVTSDHGDEFFEHGGIGHRRNLAEAVIRVPMLLRLPGVLPANHAEPGLVSLTDVTPTILEIVGVPSPAPMSGQSILPLGAIDEGARRPLLSRLVRIYDGVMHADDGTVPIRTATVQEAFRYGTIKIVRRRRWTLLPPTLPEGARERAQKYSNRQFRQEELAWVDLARAADVPSAYSTDFREPAAHRALGVVRRRYRRLQAVRSVVMHDEPIGAVLRSKLAGLGYLTESAAPTSPLQGFLLPVPGARSAGPP